MNLQEAFKILDISSNATKIEVKRKFNNLAKIHHPDKCIKNPQLAQQFVEIQKAYKYLIDFVPNDSNNSDNKQPSQQPAPSEYSIIVSLEEIYQGCIRNEKIKINIIDRNNVKTIQEKMVQVSIKPGILPGGRIAVNKQGDQHYGMIPANAVFIVKELPHAIFKRSRFALECIAKIKAEDAFRGEFTVMTIEKQKITQKVNELITPKTVHRIANHGMPIPDGGGKRGDLLVKFEIIYEFQDPAVKIDIFLTLEQIYNGVNKKFKIKRSIIDSDGKEEFEEVTVQVPIKPGVKSGTKFTFAKEGDRRHGSTPADIIFTVRDKPHPHFKRNGPNLEYTAIVAPKQKGTQFEIPILGPNMKLNVLIDDDILSGRAVKSFPGYGLPYSTDDQKFGVLLVKFVVVDNEAIDPPIRYDLFVTLEEILHGCEKRMKIKRKIIDNEENEISEEIIKTIVIKPGAEEGTEYILSRCGDQYPGLIPGDIIFVVRYKSHECFTRKNGVDLEYVAKLTQSTFAAGGVIQIPTLESELNLSLSSIVNPFKLKRFPGNGLPHPDDPQQRGDLFVRFEIIEDPIQDPEVIHVLLLTPKQMLDGCTKNVKINRIVSDELGEENMEENILEIKIEPQSGEGARIVFPQASNRYPDRIAADIVFIIKLKPQEPSIEHKLPLTLEDILNGCIKLMRITKKIFDGDGIEQTEAFKIVQIEIKPGTEDGARFIFPQEGDHRPGVTPADVIFIVQLNSHQHFKPNGVHLEYSHPISSDEINDISETQPLELLIPSLDEHFVRTILTDYLLEKRIANYGLPYSNNPTKRGDLIVKFKIIYPFDDDYQLIFSESDDSEEN